MKLTEKQEIEQAEAIRCTAHIRTMLSAIVDEKIGFHILLYCLEIEVHRLKTVILEFSAATGLMDERNAGGMYQ